MATQTQLTTPEKARFFHQFGALLNSGMSVQQSLTLVGKDFNDAFQRYLRKVGAAMKSGQDLASALALNPSFFDSWTLSLIGLAEYNGSLADTFERLATSAEHQHRREKLYGSVKIATLATIWGLLVLIVAIFKHQSTGFLNPIFWFNALGLALLLFGLSIGINHYPGRLLPQLIARLPGFGNVMRARSMLCFAELELPLRCGVSVVTALDLVRDRIPDPILRDNLSSASRAVRAGQPLSQSLEGKLPPLALQLIHTGEITGNLDDAFRRMAEFYEGELERSLKQLEGILRPLSLMILGALVAVLGVRMIKLMLNSLPG